MEKTVTHLRRIALLAGLIVVMSSGALINCATAATYEELNTKANDLIKEAEDLASLGKNEEAYKIVSYLEDLYPNDPRVQKIRSSLNEAQIASIAPQSWLGYNKASRVAIEPTTGEKFLWYIPDRLADFTEMVEVWVDIGSGFLLDVHITRAIEGSLGAWSGGGVGVFGQKRNVLGVRLETTATAKILLAGPTYIAGYRLGLGGYDQYAGSTMLHLPRSEVYQNYRDYYAIGYKIGWLILGVEGHYHPIEIFDFLAGILMFDPLNDDWMYTRQLRYSSRQRQLAQQVQQYKANFSEDEIQIFQRKFPRLGLDKPVDAR